MSCFFQFFPFKRKLCGPFCAISLNLSGQEPSGLPHCHHHHSHHHCHHHHPPRSPLENTVCHAFPCRGGLIPVSPSSHPSSLEAESLLPSFPRRGSYGLECLSDPHGHAAGRWVGTQAPSARTHSVSRRCAFCLLEQSFCYYLHPVFPLPRLT